MKAGRALGKNGGESAGSPVRTNIAHLFRTHGHVGEAGARARLTPVSGGGGMRVMAETPEPTHSVTCLVPFPWERRREGGTWEGRGGVERDLRGAHLYGGPLSRGGAGGDGRTERANLVVGDPGRGDRKAQATATVGL